MGAGAARAGSRDNKSPRRAELQQLKMAAAKGETEAAGKN
ncbi:hypothetical protein RB2501_01700 [Robiginitalea biformata HTCC2501]|uniref:Uncharacterized protein n=1 Tax=Robiginitalea biformata (strain ATCC BAA-864 / DSM 15991 / KCTC 12146 / HTCC2501) TaxID=313596 RepID=A4CQ15_ROBBH|nr:hypothetical protein RB2501_01700 [Robiginitalea biformata HTCC2501]